MVHRFSLLTLALLLASALATPARADLDVTVPPGLPPEWIRLLPTPVLTDHGLVPRARSNGKEGSVESIPNQDRPRYEGGVDTSFGFSGITTIDLPDHFPWSVPRKKTITGTKAIELTGTGGIGLTGIQYPPAVPIHLYWLALATMLRKAIHPSMVSQTATIEFLVLLGEPAYLAATNARMDGSLSAVTKAVRKFVGPIQASRPLPIGGKNAYQRLINNLAVAELASGFPYSPDRRFARRLLSMGGEALAPVLACTKHKHKLVRRNAVTLLGKFRDERASRRLRQLLGDADRVVRNRALNALVSRRDAKTVPWLIKALATGDRGTRVLACNGLGTIGDKRGLGPVAAYAKANVKDPDALWVAIPAVARLAKRKDKKILAQLAALESRLRADPKLYGKPRPVYPAPQPDKLTTADVLAEMCQIARAGIGSASAQEALMRLIEKGPRKKPNKRIKQLGNTLKRRGGKLGSVSLPNLFFVCEMLRRMGRRGNGVLKDVIEDTSEETSVRAFAMGAIDYSTIWTYLEALDWVAGIATSNDTGLVRATALGVLQREDIDLALTKAREIVEEYAGGAPDYDSMRRDWVVIPAMQLLGRNRANKIETLVKVANRAEPEQAEGEKRYKKVTPGAIKANPATIKSVSIPPILQTALIELGRTGEAKVVPYLRRFLDDANRLGRAEAALALGAIGGPKVIKRLVGALGDADGWVRFCAYRSLRQLTKADFCCDWLFAKPSVIGATIRSWKDWLAKQ